jgi:gliding motility-associated-like protein
MIKFCPLVIVFLFFSLVVSGQNYIGTEFRFAFLKNLNPLFNEPPVFDISIHALADLTATVEFGTPSDNFYQIETIDIFQGEVGVVSFDDDEFLYQEDVYVTDNRSFKVTTTAEARVYAFHNRIFFAESSAIIPTSSLGSEYYVMAYEGSNGTAPSLFNILATADGTQVEVTPSANTLLGAAGSTFTLDLDAGEVITISSSEDLTGSRIVSGQNPVAVFGGQQQGLVGPPGCLNDSHFWEEMIPLNNWSTTYPIFPLQNNGGDLFRVLAASDGTELYQGCEFITTLDAGEIYEAFYTDPFVLNTSEPVLVAAYLRGKECSGNDTGDPNMRLLLPAERGNTDLRLRINNPLIDGAGPFSGPALDVIHLVMPTDNISELNLNGNPITTWQIFTNYPELSYAEVDIPPLTNLLTVNSTTPFWAEQLSLEGFDAFTMSMGSDSEISLPPFENLTVDLGPDQSICPGESLILDPGLSQSGVWQDDSIQETYTVTEPGIYSVTIEGACGDGADEVEIFGGLVPTVTLPPELVICFGQEAVIEVLEEPNVTYAWNTGQSGSSIGISDFGIYSVTAESDDGCISEASVNVIDGATADLEVLFPEAICPGRTDTIIAFANEVGSYLWDSGSQNPEIVIDQPGVYTVVFTPDQGCPVSEEVRVEEKQEPIVFASDTSICSGDVLQLRGQSPNGNVFWPGLSDSPVLEVTREGFYEVAAENECGMTFFTVNIGIKDCSCQVFVPNAFTPNGDGLNDLFVPQIPCDPDFFELVIFNRWGRQVFFTNDSDIHWNGGSIENKQFFCPAGVYTYLLRYDNPLRPLEEREELTGTVTLIR